MHGNQVVQGPKDSPNGLKKDSRKFYFFLNEKRKTWTSLMTWGRVNYHQKFIYFLYSELLL